MTEQQTKFALILFANQNWDHKWHLHPNFFFYFATIFKSTLKKCSHIIRKKIHNLNDSAALLKQFISSRDFGSKLEPGTEKFNS